MSGLLLLSFQWNTNMSVDLSLFICSDDASDEVRGFNVYLISAGKYPLRKSSQIEPGWLVHSCPELTPCKCIFNEHYFSTQSTQCSSATHEQQWFDTLILKLRLQNGKTCVYRFDLWLVVMEPWSLGSRHFEEIQVTRPRNFGHTFGDHFSFECAMITICTFLENNFN